MHIAVEKSTIADPEKAILRCGYGKQVTRDGEVSYTRRLTRNPFPRFHVYIKQETEQYIFNLHLDQRQPSYEGVTAHSGEYDGPVVENEGARIRRLLGAQ